MAVRKTPTKKPPPKTAPSSHPDSFEEVRKPAPVPKDIPDRKFFKNKVWPVLRSEIKTMVFCV